MSYSPYRIVLYTIISILILGTIKTSDDKKNFESEKHTKTKITEDLRVWKHRNLQSKLESEEKLKDNMKNQNTKQEAKIKYGLINDELLSNIKSQVEIKDRLCEEYDIDESIIMKEGQEYNKTIGITTFRGNTYRDSASYGNADITQRKLEKIWHIPIGAIDRWTGIGWNGQPAIVKWDKEILNMMNIFQDKKDKSDLKEVIYGALDGKIYFIDLEDGSYTREPIKVPGPIKGSVTVDPRGIPLLYAGQGINRVNGNIVEMGYRVFSLIDQKKLFFINGRDTFAHRTWSAFDSTALIDEDTDSLLICGENGIFYRVKLNTEFDLKQNTIDVNPEVIKYRYKISGNNYQGIENSVAAYRNLAYFADNGGWLQCIDINSLKPVWIRDVTDDTDSTIVLEEKGEELYLYTACEVDKQGTKGKSYIRKIDGLSGKLIWERSYVCDSKLGTNPNNGGALATPVVGKHDLGNIVIYNLARYGGYNKGLLVALDKETGEEVWRFELNNYSWSSPVAVYSKNGEGFIILCDSGGNIHLFDGKTGTQEDKINLEANVEGSPAVFEDIIVVGTRGQKIYGIKIK